MIDDFTPILHVIAGRTIKVWAIADVHIGSKECDLEGFQAFLNQVEQDPDSFLVLCGDIINNGLKTSLTNVYEETMPPSLQIETATNLLAPVKDRILGVVGGNHELRSHREVDLDPMYTICCMLGIPQLYRQRMAFLRVALKRGDVKDFYSLLLVHGGSAIKKRKFAYTLEGIDCIISGHTHDGIVEKPARLCFNHRNTVEVKSLVSVTASSWLSYGGYGASALYQPKTTSNPQYVELEFAGTNTRRGSLKVVW